MLPHRDEGPRRVEAARHVPSMPPRGLAVRQPARNARRSPGDYPRRAGPPSNFPEVLTAISAGSSDDHPTWPMKSSASAFS